MTDEASIQVQRQMVADLHRLGWNYMTRVYCPHRKRTLTMGEVFDTHCTMLLVLGELENRAPIL
jgi:hypothetical protein